MKDHEPKRRTTQMGIGQSGTRPRADETPDASSEEMKGVLCPPPSTPPVSTRRATTDEHATVEFGDDAAASLRHGVRERAVSATNEIDENAKKEIARRDSVREFMAAAAAVRAGRGSVVDGGEVRDRAAHAVTLPALDRAAPAVPESAPPASTRNPAAAAAPPESAPASRRAPYVERAPISSHGTSGSGKPERQALRVDDVGTAAVRLAARTPHDATPRVLVDRRTLASAPIDHREAFLVSLMDGRLTVSALVDVSGMREGEVATALQRLARLGLVAF